MDRYTVSDIFR